MTLDSSRALLQVRIDPQAAIRFASSRYDIPNNPCYCVNPNNYNYDQYGRAVDGRNTLFRRQVGNCSAIDPFQGVDAILAREAFQIRPSFYRAPISTFGGYDTQNIGRGGSFKYGGACSGSGTSLDGGYSMAAEDSSDCSYESSASSDMMSQDVSADYSYEMSGNGQSYSY